MYDIIVILIGICQTNGDGSSDRLFKYILKILPLVLVENGLNLSHNDNGRDTKKGEWVIEEKRILVKAVNF